MKFDFASPTRIVFGAGKLREAGVLVQPHGNRALVVTSRNPARAEPALEQLQSADITTTVFPTEGEPDVALIARGVEACSEANCNVVIGFGGGSALDAAKAIAALSTNPGDPLDYLEVVGRGQPIKQTPLPFIAIPTTAGTGSEVTRNAVLGSPEHQVKVSLRSPLMLAKVAIVDPELTLDLPPAITASTGMDALTQCIEAYVSCKATPLTDAFCLEGIRRAAQSLHRAFSHGHDLEARRNMAMTSLCSGIALANAGLGAVHGFAGPIGGMFPAPHGAVCAALLPHVMKANLEALRARAPGHPGPSRFDVIAQLLTGDRHAGPETGIEWVRELQQTLGISKLGKWGVQETHTSDIVRKAAAASSMKGNPLKLVESELRTILAAALRNR